jgi:uncharacterized repeat protein (TIGR01451 family)
MVLAFLTLGVAGTARAVGTPANTPVDNLATVQYDVGATTQPVIESSPTGNSTAGVGNGTPTNFVVDDRVDLTVAEFSGGYTVVAAGGLSEVLVFTVTNTGNATHDFSLTATDQVGGADPFGGTDNFDALPAVGIFVDANADDVYQPGTDVGTWVDELGDDDAATVFVVRNIPGGQANGDVSAVRLTAQVAAAGGVGVQGADILADDAGIADDPATVQIVFADGAGDIDAARDGAFSGTDAFRVGAAQISVSKTSQVLSDPINGPFTGVAPFPKAIPGAVVEYTITVANAVAASATATNVQVTDSLAAEIASGAVVFDAAAYGVGGIQVTSPNLYGGAATGLTNAADADEGDFTADVVTVTGISLDAGETATVRFRVVIQ